MPLSQRDQFKVNLLASFADAGLTVKEARETVQRMTDNLRQIVQEKQAGPKDWPVIGNISHMFDKATDAGADTATWAAKNLIGWGIPTLAFGPAAIGGLGGYAASKATDIDDDDVAAQKQREMIDLYRAELAQLKRRR